MKYVYSLILLFVGVAVMAQQTQEAELDPKNGPIITFTESVFDFGEIEQGEIVEHVFVFENTGNAPLIISNAKGSCGCTIPKYEKEVAIAPGETSEMLVRFNSRGKSGVQSKTVTVYSNAQNSVERIRIKTSITVPPPAEDGSGSGN